MIEKKMSPAIKEAENIVIKDADDMKQATEVLSVLNRFNDAMTAEKERVTKPLLQALNAERKRWKPLETMYEGAIALLRRKMTKYQTDETAKAKAEEAKIAARVGEGKGKLKVETAVRKMGEIEAPDKRVSTNAGMVKFRPVKKFEVTDLSALANYADGGYILPNETAIRKAMMSGIEIPGVRYYEEQVPVNIR